ncbi:MarR family winged helix-turn-helix transcriptional regulator [Microlunatus flavus]|uniref:DNA-binding transcriptional regulator, MarR family n=1 Tax=Microlunatus flavus TaxID=1036181 RepID=A0A1H9G599_9ACTN|nr:MarR family transcriptional regulator [Microlunatus flavus]SEQ45287.1 DNA-binding transcriptional regulator, MarR family [Microlunatus flavus]
MLRTFDGDPADEGAELPVEALAAEARSISDDPAHAADAGLDDAVITLRSLVRAVERYRTSVSSSTGVGTTESQALSYLLVHGDRGQSELARELTLTSSAATALVDRLERHGVAERVRHPSDRRRTIIRLTHQGEQLADRVHQPLYASLGRVDAADLPAVSRWMGVIADGLLGVRAGLA